MIKVYKIMTGKDKIDKEQFFPLADSNYGLRGHSLRSDVISSTTLPAFKRLLKTELFRSFPDV